MSNQQNYERLIALGSYKQATISQDVILLYIKEALKTNEVSKEQVRKYVEEHVPSHENQVTFQILKNLINKELDNLAHNQELDNKEFFNKNIKDLFNENYRNEDLCHKKQAAENIAKTFLADQKDLILIDDYIDENNLEKYQYIGSKNNKREHVPRETQALIQFRTMINESYRALQESSLIIIPDSKESAVAENIEKSNDCVEYTNMSVDECCKLLNSENGNSIAQQISIDFKREIESFIKSFNEKTEKIKNSYLQNNNNNEERKQLINLSVDEIVKNKINVGHDVEQIKLTELSLDELIDRRIDAANQFIKRINYKLEAANSPVQVQLLRKRDEEIIIENKKAPVIAEKSLFSSEISPGHSPESSRVNSSVNAVPVIARKKYPDEKTSLISSGSPNSHQHKSSGFSFLSFFRNLCSSSPSPSSSSKPL